MKLHYYLLPLCLGLGLTTSCSSNDDEEWMLVNNDQPEYEKFETMSMFPEKDSSTKLSGNIARKVSKLLDIVGPSIGESLPRMMLNMGDITDEQYAEIKTFTDELVADLNNDLEKYNAIFKWITTNVKYGMADNRPYEVFISKKGVCQGYANLLNVMLNTQNIPVVNVNGWLDPLGGHAWNYVYVNRGWRVSDPTNNGQFTISNYNDYKHLQPWSVDMDIFPTDSTVCSFYDELFNLTRVRKADDVMVVPYSLGGITLACFSPDSLLPANVKEIYIGSNIESLGETMIGLNTYAPNVERVYVDPANKKLEEYKGIVYAKSGSKLLYIPNGLKVVEILPVPVIEKNYIAYLDGVEELIIPAGVNEICAYAIEDCPNLKKAYVPEGVVIDDHAFYGVHADFEIVRKDLTCIPEIKM